MKNISKVFTDGNLVDVSVRTWSGQRALQPADLGLSSTHISEAFKLGKKALIPREKIAMFKRIDQRARSVLSRFSFPFAFGSARFVPKKAFIKFIESFDKVQKDFYAEVDSLIEDYDAYRIAMRKEYVEAAEEAYIRYTSISKIEVDKDEFINDFLERVESFYPAKEELRDKFYMDYTVFRVALPDLTRATYDDLMDEGEKIKMLQMAKQAELQERVRKFVDSTLETQRSRASKVLGHLEESIRSGKKITKASINSVKTMIEDYESLDIIGDKKFLQVLKNFRDEHLKHLNDKVLKQVPEHGAKICEMLQDLIKLAEDQSDINVLVNAYKSRMDI